MMRRHYLALFRRLPQGKKCTEVSIFRKKDPVLAGRELEECLIVSSLKAEITHMYSIKAGRAEALGELRRQRIVYEEGHVPVSSGNWRSSTAAAANLSDWRISSISRSGYSSII